MRDIVEESREAEFGDAIHGIARNIQRRETRMECEYLQAMDNPKLKSLGGELRPSLSASHVDASSTHEEPSMF